jgi:G:T-mismatch repair DNA endonuclease (very short patch repair protein)
MASVRTLRVDAALARATRATPARKSTARRVATRASREEELMAKLMGMMGLGGDGIIGASDALPGRDAVMRVSETHYVLKGNLMREPFPEHLERAVFATGCFWGTEKVRLARALDR